MPRTHALLVFESNRGYCEICEAEVRGPGTEHSRLTTKVELPQRRTGIQELEQKLGKGYF